MNILLAVLQGALWLAVRLGLLLLGLLAVVLVLALVILLCPFCADLSWEEDPDDPEGWGKVKIRAGALGLTFPVFTWPVPPPAAAGQEEAKPGFLARLWGRLKEKLRARRAGKAARKPPKKPAASQPKQKAKLTLYTYIYYAGGGRYADPGGLRSPAGDPHPGLYAGDRGGPRPGGRGLWQGQRLALPGPGRSEPLDLYGF